MTSSQPTTFDESAELASITKDYSDLATQLLDVQDISDLGKLQ